VTEARTGLQRLRPQRIGYNKLRKNRIKNACRNPSHMRRFAGKSRAKGIIPVWMPQPVPCISPERPSPEKPGDPDGQEPFPEGLPPPRHHSM
jgi:hypothetical protein